MATRAKFRVNQVVEQRYVHLEREEVYSVLVQMNPVYSPDENSENNKFWKASPSGTLSLWINNPEAYKQFKEGQEYYLDFTLAD